MILNSSELWGKRGGVRAEVGGGGGPGGCGAGRMASKWCRNPPGKLMKQNLTGSGGSRPAGALPGVLIGHEFSPFIGTKSKVEPPPGSILRKFSCHSVKCVWEGGGREGGTSASSYSTFLCCFWFSKFHPFPSPPLPLSPSALLPHCPLSPSISFLTALGECFVASWGWSQPEKKWGE